MELCSCGGVDVVSYGDVELWSCDVVELCECGDVDVCTCGCVESWSC